jgi:magnesium transporter
MLLDLKFSIGTLGLAAGTLLSALYGMNLKNFIEESDLGFGAVSLTCFVCSIIVSLYGLAKLRKVQRVRMWGEGMDSTGIGPLQHRRLALNNRGNWRSDAIEPMLAGLPGEGRSERLRRFKEAVKSNPGKGNSPTDAARRAAILQAQQLATRQQSKENKNAEGESDEVAAKT